LTSTAACVQASCSHTTSSLLFCLLKSISKPQYPCIASFLTALVRYLSLSPYEKGLHFLISFFTFALEVYLIPLA
jgi:hypothetical protein